MSILADLLICLRFFSRLPLPSTRRENELCDRGFVMAAALAPLAGALLGLVPSAIALAASIVGVPPSVAAPLAVAALVGVTGALHEDALADCADGFGGGHTRDRKLDIMRDSRIGAYGTVAVALTLYVRAAALAAVLAQGVGAGISALLLAATVSRTACLAPLFLLPPARPDGLGAAAARPTAASMAIAVALALAAAALIAAAGAGWTLVAIAMAVAAVLALAICALAWRQIAGQTGDVAGAAQAITEAGVLIVFSTWAS